MSAPHVVHPSSVDEAISWLAASGATVLVADTDNSNPPMARAFADVGWPQTETRIDLVR